MRQFGKVDIQQNALLNALKINDNYLNQFILPKKR